MLVRVRRSTLYSCLGMLPQRYVFLPTAAILGTTHMIGLGGTDAKPAQACVGATVLNGLPCVVRRRKIREKKLKGRHLMARFIAALILFFRNL